MVDESNRGPKKKTGSIRREVSMINLKISDGLGNQMFQYAFGRALSELCHDRLYLNTLHFAQSDLRHYSLKHFYLNDEVKEYTKWQQYATYVYGKLKYSYLSKIKYKTFKGTEVELLQAFNKEGVYYGLSPYEYYEIQKSCAAIKYVNGYWQSPKFFSQIESQLQKELRVKTKPSKENEAMLQQIAQDNAVCVHIRRGDYIGSSFDICTEAYYQKAMEVIASKVENPIFYIFSNSSEDLQWIKENYHFNHSLVYVDLNNCDYEELRLMYSCKHFIISNSTFSWWGAYLSTSPTKVVVAPSKWNQDYKVVEDLYLDNWIKVGVEATA